MATRRTTPPPPAAVRLNPEQLRKGIARLERIIDEVGTFDPSTLTKRFGPEQDALSKRIDGALSSIFGQGTAEYQRYRSATRLDMGAVVMKTSWSRHDPREDIEDARSYGEEGKESSLQTLRQAVQWLQDELADFDEQAGPTDNAVPTIAVTLPRKVFIVHGHDDAARQSVARFVERIGFEAVILSEQANRGRTIIEKIEAHSDVGFAVVLLTPDDSGSKLGEPAQPRARQNVLLELGYFMGKLGRSNVCSLATTSAIEIPTDFAGVVWEPYDAAGGWKQSLAKELSAAGFDIDWNKVMR